MNKYGLKDSDGNILIPCDYDSIHLLCQNLLAVKKSKNVALYNTDGKPLTKFKYSDISFNKENGSITAIRNQAKGTLDNEGKELVEETHFKGGYIRSLFGDYSVLNDANEVVIPSGYSRIEILDEDGLFTLWKDGVAALGDISKKMTEFVYSSVKSIGKGFYIVSRVISKKKGIRKTGYGFYGNPYTYYKSEIVNEKRYGIIDRNLQMIIPCRYSSISDFDDEYNVIAKNEKDKSKSISLQDLKRKASHIFVPSIGTEYDVTVKAFMAIGIIVKIQGNSFVIHKKQLYKDKKDFKKGDELVAKFLGNDQNGYQTWETKAKH